MQALRGPQRAAAPSAQRAKSACLPRALVQRNVRARATSTQQELEEIDPMTGEVINKLAASAPAAGNKVKAGELEWAYRKSTLAEGKNASDISQVLLIHGLGSSSYSYRNSLGFLGGEGITAYAPDWIGHGDSDKPSPSAGFDYSEEAFARGLGQFIDAVGITKPFALVVQGYILSQYALQYALDNPGQVARLMILNTPLSKKTALRPELAPYKSPLPFMRPAKGAKFDGMLFNASGSPYAMQRRDGEIYGRPYEDPAASAAISATMDKVDFGKLVSKIDEGYQTWRKPSLLLFGANDPFVDVGTTFEWLESKRTNMKVTTVPAKLGHMPQEDFPEAVHEVMMQWLRGQTDEFVAKSTSLKMTKYGVVESK